MRIISYMEEFWERGFIHRLQYLYVFSLQYTKNIYVVGSRFSLSRVEMNVYEARHQLTGGASAITHV